MSPGHDVRLSSIEELSGGGTVDGIILEHRIS